MCNIRKSDNCRLEIIDYFKGISIIMIFICHLVQVFDIPSSLSAISSFGRMGCQMFFVMSGYTITMSYEKSYSDMGTFYIKRWLSLAPGYWMAILITILIAVITFLVSGENQLGTSLKIGDVAVNLLMLNGLIDSDANNLVFRGGWFVGTLFLLYILYPILYKGYKKYGEKFLCASIVSSMNISAICLLVTSNVYSSCGDFWYFSFINQLPPFVLGIMLCKRPKNNNNALLKSLLLFIVSLVLFYHPTCPFKAVFIPTIFSLSFIYLLIAIWNKRLICSNLLSKVGKLSYSIFLLHIFFIWDVPRLILHSFMPLNTLTCIIWGIIAFIVVYIVSIYFNKFITFLSNRLKMLL